MFARLDEDKICPWRKRTGYSFRCRIRVISEIISQLQKYWLHDFSDPVFIFGFKVYALLPPCFTNYYFKEKMMVIVISTHWICVNWVVLHLWSNWTVIQLRTLWAVLWHISFIHFCNLKKCIALDAILLRNNWQSDIPSLLTVLNCSSFMI